RRGGGADGGGRAGGDHGAGDGAAGVGWAYAGAGGAHRTPPPPYPSHPGGGEPAVPLRPPRRLAHLRGRPDRGDGARSREALMADHRLTPPLTEAQVRALQVGDIVTLDGHIWGIRDATQIRIFDHSVAPPQSLEGAVCLHTAPGVRKVGDRYEPVSIGTTTSTRMERFTPLLMEQYGVRAIVGKAGLLEGSVTAMQQFGGCYLTIVGGAAALET